MLFQRNTRALVSHLLLGLCVILLSTDNGRGGSGRGGGGSGSPSVVVLAEKPVVQHRFIAWKPLCVAHRGQRDEHPENTMLAFRMALDNGADGLELDLRLTSDDELVIFHDELLQYVTNGTGFIRKRPYAGYVEHLRVKNQRKQPPTGGGGGLSAERIPKFRWLLDDLLRQPAYANQPVLLDVKDTNDLAVLDRLLDVLLRQTPPPPVGHPPWNQRFTIGIWNEAFWYRAERLFGSRGFGLSLITKSLRLPWRDPFYHGVGNLNLHFDALKRDKTGFLERMRGEVEPESESEQVTIDAASDASADTDADTSSTTTITATTMDRTYFGWTINTREDMELAIEWRLDSILTDHIRVCRQIVDGLHDHHHEQQHRPHPHPRPPQRGANVQVTRP